MLRRTAPLLIAGLMACTTPFSGPLRTVPLESVAPVGEDHASIGATGGGHVSGIEHAGVHARIGLARDVDIGGEGSWVSLGDVVQGTGQYGIGHVDVRHRVHEVLAFSGGVGVGGGPYGLYGGPDVGVILGYENPYLVPFVALRIGLSVPLLPTPFVSTSGGMTRSVDPVVTLYMQPTVGLRVPVVLDALLGQRVDFIGGACFTAGALLDGSGNTAGLFGGELGIDFIL